MEASRELGQVEEEREISLEEKVENYVKDINDIAKSKKGLFKRKRAIKEFIKGNDEAREDLNDYFKQNAGYVQRATTWGKKERAKQAVNEYEISQTPNPFKRFLKKHKSIIPAIVATQAFVSALSPNHPIMVDVYLADRVHEKMAELVVGSEDDKKRVNDFISNADLYDGQLASFVEDVSISTSEKTFAIVSNGPDLEIRNIRTFNSLLNPPLDIFFKKFNFDFPMYNHLRFSTYNFLDNRSYIRLDDLVDLWLKDYDIIALGHYHSFGGPPSFQDIISQKITAGPDVVLSNGFVPFNYLDGEFVPYNGNFDISENTTDLFWKVTGGVSAALPYSSDDAEYLTSDNVNGDKPPELAKKYVNSFLGFLSQRYDIDPNDSIQLEKAIKYHHATNFRQFQQATLDSANYLPREVQSFVRHNECVPFVTPDVKMSNAIGRKQLNFMMGRKATDFAYYKLNTSIHGKNGHRINTFEDLPEDSPYRKALDYMFKDYPGGPEQGYKDINGGKVDYNSLMGLSNGQRQNNTPNSQ